MSPQLICGDDFGCGLTSVFVTTKKGFDLVYLGLKWAEWTISKNWEQPQCLNQFNPNTPFNTQTIAKLGFSETKMQTTRYH